MARPGVRRQRADRGVRDGLDDQGRRGTWPNPVDTPLDRARRIAGMYRARLRALDRDACDDCDATAVGFGETWMVEKPDIVDPTREMTTNEAAELAQTSPEAIRHWARCKHPDDPTRMLLPRFGWRGRERTYIAGKILEAAALVRTRQLAR